MTEQVTLNQPVRRRITRDEATPVAEQLLDWMRAVHLKQGVWVDSFVIQPFSAAAHVDPQVVWRAWQLLRRYGRIIESSGQSRWVVVSYKPLRDNGNWLTRLFGG